MESFLKHAPATPQFKGYLFMRQKRKRHFQMSSKFEESLERFLSSGLILVHHHSHHCYLFYFLNVFIRKLSR